jgi:hypothetical protein
MIYAENDPVLDEGKTFGGVHRHHRHGIPPLGSKRNHPRQPKAASTMWAGSKVYLAMEVSAVNDITDGGGEIALGALQRDFDIAAGLAGEPPAVGVLDEVPDGGFVRVYISFRLLFLKHWAQ